MQKSAVGVRAALISLVIVGGWLLGHTARWFADGLVVNAQLYFHAFRLAEVRSPWVVAPLRFLSGAVLQYSGLASWAFACGYCCARLVRSNLSLPIWLWWFGAVAFLGTAFTTTSVRIAQPWFFEPVLPGTVYSLAVRLLFVLLPAGLAARAVRHRSTSAPVLSVVALIGIVLAWWSASDLGHALTFGCVPPETWGVAYCAPREIPWGTAVACALTALGAVMAWDAMTRQNSPRPLQFR